MIENAITPRNYAANAQREMRLWADAARHDPALVDDAAMVRYLADLVDKAVHFSLPEGGMLFDDALRGLRGQELHLPFPVIMIEYPAKPGPIDPTVEHPVGKRLAIALEGRGADLADSIGRGIPGLRHFGDERIIAVISVCDWQGDNVAWLPAMGGYAMPGQGWDDVKGEPLRPIIPRPDAGGFSYNGTIFPVMKNLCVELMEKVGDEELGWRHLADGVMDEVRVTIELCEALTCSNVRTATLQEASPANARRVRDGKLPILETRVLTIDVPVAKGAGARAGAMGDRASPREHLRRGHIRELPDGRRIWVSPAVIGAGNQGRINKSYRLRAS
jgi:hypothetical protein